MSRSYSMEELPLVQLAPLASDRVEPFAGHRPYLATGSLNGHEAASIEPVTYESRPSRADLQVKPGDVICARMQATNKVLEITSETSDYIVSTGFAVHRPNQARLSSRYLWYFLNSEYFQHAKDQLCTGATQRAITNAGIEALRIPVPSGVSSLETQARIVAILEHASAVRRLRTEQQQLGEQLLESAFVEMFGDPVVNSQDLPEARLDKMASVGRGKFTPRPRNDSKFYNGPYPFIQTGNIASSDCYVTAWSQTLNDQGAAVSKKFPKGTVVVAIVGATIGETAILDFECYFPDSVVGIQPIQGESCSEYIEYALRFWKPIFRAQAPETARANINLETLRPLVLPKPPIEKQERFGELYRQTHALKSKQRLHADDLFESVLQQAFRGEL